MSYQPRPIWCSAPTQGGSGAFSLSARSCGKSMLPASKSQVPLYCFAARATRLGPSRKFAEELKSAGKREHETLGLAEHSVSLFIEVGQNRCPTTDPRLKEGAPSITLPCDEPEMAGRQLTEQRFPW